MRRVMILLAVILPLCAAAGCNTPDSRKVVMARQVYTATVNSVADFRQAGAVPDEALRAFDAARLAARAVIDRADQKVAAGEPLTQVDMSDLQNAMATLQQLQTQLKGLVANDPGGNSGAGGRGN